MKNILFTLIFFLTCFGVGVGGLGAYLMSPVMGAQTPPTSFIVSKGESVAVIATNLQNRGFIHSNIIFRLLYKQLSNGVPIQSGTYDLSPSFSSTQIVKVLLKGSKDVWVTFIEGWRKEEMAQELQSQLGTQFFSSKEFLSLSAQREGTLFPDTYLFPKQVTAHEVVNRLEENFQKKYTSLLHDYGPTSLTQNQVLTLASIVGREARTSMDMQIIAGVLMNRLQAGMPLQSDITLQYIKGYDPQLKTWWPPPKAADKFINSPFNTYMNKGLPPQPIDNPGTAAIRAVLHPDKSDFLFYLADNEGVVHFARTLQEHDALIQKYLR